MYPTIVFSFVLCLLSSAITTPTAKGSRDDDDLGSRISGQVRRSLNFNDDWQKEFQESLRKSLAPLNNIGIQNRQGINDDWQKDFQASLQQSLAPLQNLGAQIEHEVYDSLEPVRRMEAVNNLKNGLNGVTIAKYKPSGKTFVIQDGSRYECSGEISYENGECKGKLESSRPNRDEDYCYVETRAHINNHLCFTIGTGVSIYAHNGKITCNGSDGTPGKIFDIEDYVKLCKSKSDSVDFAYFLNQDTEPNKLLDCKKTGSRTICNYTENNRLAILTSGNTFTIQ